MKRSLEVNEMIHALVYIGVVFMIYVLEVIYIAIWTLIYYKLGDDDFDVVLSKGLMFLLIVFTIFFSKYLTDKIIEKNDVGVVFETVSENGDE